MILQLLVVLCLEQTPTVARKDIITVTAEPAKPENLDLIPQRVNVIQLDLLRERTSVGFNDAFREEVGLETQRTSSFMGGIYIRGLTGNKIVVYRDGVRYSNSSGRGGVSTFFNLLDSSGIQQAEILRGPNSAQYGSDSLGGVLHVISRQPEKLSPRLEWSPFYSSASHTFGNSLSFTRSSDRGGIVLRGSGQRVNTLRTGAGLDSHSAITRFLNLPSRVAYSRQPDSGFTQYGASFHTQLKQSPSADWILHYERDQQDGAKRTDQLLGGDGASRAEVANIMGDFAYLRHNHSQTAGFDLVSGSISYAAQREERINQSRSSAPEQRQYERTRTWGLQGQAAKRILRQDLYVGGEVYFDHFSSTAQNTLPRIAGGSKYKSYGAYLQDSLLLWQQRLRISGALRWGGGQFESITANAWTGRIGAVLRATSWFSVHSYVSRGFRAPSLTDLGSRGLQGNGNFEALPLQGLVPEFSDNIDLGFRLRGKGLHWELTGFRSQLSNVIVSQTLLLPQGAIGQVISGERITSQRPDGAVFVAISNAPVTAKRNLDSAIFKGIEQRLKWSPRANITLEQGLTWLRADDPATGRVPNLEGAYPPAMGYLKLRYNPAGKRFWLEPYWTLNDRQNRLSELALNDRRTGAFRTPNQIATFYNNNPALAALSNQTLPQLQTQLGNTALFNALPGYGIVGLRGGYTLSDQLSIFLDAANLADKSYRGMSWGIDGPGRGVSLQLRWRL
jgi:hemoglobin/transferrin/lactoferrin receptor protein